MQKIIIADQNERFSMRRPSISLIVFVLLFPLVQAYLYFMLMADWQPTFQRTTYSLSKAAMLALPLFCTMKIAREPWLARPFNKRGLLEGSVFGIIAMVTIGLVYYLWFKPAGLLGQGTAPDAAITEKVTTFGMATPLRFILLGVFVSFIHSGLEEYYWRWFAFGQLRRIIPTAAAIIVAGLGFMLHHIIIIGVYFGFTRPETWFFSLAVALGGAYWCWLYVRKDSIYAPWLSHAWIDMAIFIVGYDIVFGR